MSPLSWERIITGITDERRDAKPPMKSALPYRVAERSAKTMVAMKFRLMAHFDEVKVANKDLIDSYKPQRRSEFGAGAATVLILLCCKSGGRDGTHGRLEQIWEKNLCAAE